MNLIRIFGFVQHYTLGVYEDENTCKGHKWTFSCFSFNAMSKNFNREIRAQKLVI